MRRQNDPKWTWYGAIIDNITKPWQRFKILSKHVKHSGMPSEPRSLLHPGKIYFTSGSFASLWRCLLVMPLADGTRKRMFLANSFSGYCHTWILLTRLPAQDKYISRSFATVVPETDLYLHQDVWRLLAGCRRRSAARLGGFNSAYGICNTRLIHPTAGRQVGKTYPTLSSL